MPPPAFPSHRDRATRGAHPYRVDRRHTPPADTTVTSRSPATRIAAPAATARRSRDADIDSLSVVMIKAPTGSSRTADSRPAGIHTPSPARWSRTRDEEIRCANASKSEPIRIAVSARPWPISTPTLKLTMFATRPFGDSANSCSFVARPKPWKRPKISTATRVFGWNAEHAPEPVHVLERLVDDRESDDRVDEDTDWRECRRARRPAASRCDRS